MSGKWYAKEFDEDDIEDEHEAIISFANEGTPVVIICDLESFCFEMGDVEIDEIEIVT
jgi:hypothetical protein